ncbi:hypothetical protein DFJ58DRAFT_669418, partial [Suillus subalutaceus]|uniref:uncharacterized protein n=1 Tax=Suillus subalutaceus TaxID=48586 RepID=UPI001B879B31
VILNEAHHCKSRTSKTARAVYALRARRRWAVTGDYTGVFHNQDAKSRLGTPIVNKLEVLDVLLRVAKYTPWSLYSSFRLDSIVLL